MKYNFKKIHIGFLINELVTKKKIEKSRIIKFLKVDEEQINQMYESASISTYYLLLWSKLLEYDFFRIYSQHLLLYAPPTSINYKKTTGDNKPGLPRFRKNIYTIEMIHFIMKLIEKGEKTKSQIIKDYNIPKTTLYKWTQKHLKNGNKL